MKDRAGRGAGERLTEFWKDEVTEIKRMNFESREDAIAHLVSFALERIGLNDLETQRFVQHCFEADPVIRKQIDSILFTIQ